MWTSSVAPRYIGWSSLGVFHHQIVFLSSPVSVNLKGFFHSISIEWTAEWFSLVTSLGIPMCCPTTQTPPDACYRVKIHPVELACVSSVIHCQNALLQHSWKVPAYKKLEGKKLACSQVSKSWTLPWQEFCFALTSSIPYFLRALHEVLGRMENKLVSTRLTF